MKPLRDTLICEVLDMPSESSIILLMPTLQHGMGISKDAVPIAYGRVLAVGPGKPLKNGGVRPMDVKVDDLIYWAARSSEKGEIAPRTVWIWEDDVLFVVSQNSAGK